MTDTGTDLASVVEAKLAPEVLAPRLAQRLIAELSFVGATECQIFAAFLHSAVAIAKAADHPLQYGDALQASAELVWKEARVGY
jgi:hypothetical protein